MKIVRLTTLYPSYIDYFYNRNPNIESEPFHIQQSRLHYDGFGWADFWTHSMRPLGYDVCNIEVNVKPLQIAWARENDISFINKSWLRDIVIAQIQKFRPEIVFIQTESLLAKKWLIKVIRGLPSLKFLIAWVGSPIRKIYHFSECDFVLTCIPEKIEKFKKVGIPCYHLNHAFDPRILERINLEEDKRYDITFIGQILRTSRFHFGRDRILNKLIDDLDLMIFSPSTQLPFSTFLKYYMKKGIHNAARISRLDRLQDRTLQRFFTDEIARVIKEAPLSPVNRRLIPYLKPPVFGLDMYQTLRNSKITLNTHIDVSPKSASNMRLFESTGVGTCLLTDWKENLTDIFEPEKEVVTYRSPAECIEKARWLLDHPAERRAIAEAGHYRTLTDHTFAQRAQQFDDFVKKSL